MKIWSEKSNSVFSSEMNSNHVYSSGGFMEKRLERSLGGATIPSADVSMQRDHCIQSEFNQWSCHHCSRGSGVQVVGKYRPEGGNAELSLRIGKRMGTITRKHKATMQELLAINIDLMNKNLQKDYGMRIWVHMSDINFNEWDYTGQIRNK